MRTLFRHCQRCCQAITTRIHQRTTFSSHVFHPSLEHPTSSTSPSTSSNRAAFSTWSLSREAFLRPGPGRDIGLREASTQTSTPVYSSSISESEGECLGKEETISEIDPQPSASTSLNRKPATDNKVYKDIILLETDFRERFIKGGGNGGQKINKTNSNVELKHLETGIVVQCQATRSLPQNRKLARKIMIARLDEYYNGHMSKRGQKAEKIREKKKRMARKSAKKYHGAGDKDDRDDDEDEDNDDLIGDDQDDVEGKLDANLSESEDGGEKHQGSRKSMGSKKDTTMQSPLADIQFTTLEEILASDNRKSSRRKSARKD
ncbi:hypothetical protein BGW38_005908 [Lunasporangiospora selenospora]|uniref:Prokaryotic-type class I peptide chain release factors domain-containing protein n=1 Tax=Lunasporangiospora selenospora TaxID=979761 RepID=A0A9P6FZR8_9FUNG|nr:hypothetical protein BGW38_005908 [Lunasporangiospora selenospora]